MQTRCALAMLSVAAVLGVAAVTASAAVENGGHPLHVFTAGAGDSTGPGGLQARFDGETNGQFVPPTANATPAGLHIGIPGTGQLFGPTDPSALPQSTAFTPVSGPTLSGTGTVANPLVLHTTYNVGSTGLQVLEELFYSNGNNGFLAQYTVKNNGGGPVTFRPTLAGNLFLSGGSSGYGVFELGPPRLVSGLNDIVGDGGALQDVPPPGFAHYQEADTSAIWAAVANPSGPGFNDTVNPALVNPGIGIQWADTTLGAGGSATFSANWIVGGFDGLTLSPTAARVSPGNEETIAATVLNHSKPAPGVAVLYTITGANPSSGSAISDASGIARITWTGIHLGTDTVNAYADANGNGVRDAGEVLRSSVVSWRLPKPAFGKTANLTSIRGTVTVTTPRGKKIKLLGPRHIRVGSIVNLTHGVVNLITSRSPKGGTQHGTFFSGAFKLVQKKKHKPGHRPPTDLRLTGGKLANCSSSSTKATAARRRRRRRLWGSARGHFRTVGSNSAAEVRGTKWLVSDTCAGTLTVVRRGKVLVTDFTTHKTVLVKAHHSYLARFP